jgi:MFS family permease
VELEAITDKEKGPARPRSTVLNAVGANILEILGVVLAPAVAAIVLSRVLRDKSPGWSSALGLVGSVIVVSPLAMVVVILTWTRLPERRDSAFYHHPERLWGPSVATYMLTIGFGLALWRYPWLI